MANWRDTVAGSFGSVCGVYSGLPFDTVKLRLQTQTAIDLQYKGVFDCFKKIIKQEGVLALWKGVIPALSSQIIENSVLFTANGALVRSYVAYGGYSNQENLSLFQLAMIGGAAGYFSSTAICPAEVIKVRLQIQNSTKGSVRFSGTWDCLLKTLRSEGISGFYRGLPALWMRDIPFNFVYFGMFETCCSLMCQLSNKKTKREINGLQIFVSGGLAGMSAWAVCFPFDVIKSHMQTAYGNEGRSLANVVKSLYSKNGISAFYRGWSAAVLRGFPANAAIFTGVQMMERILYP